MAGALSLEEDILELVKKHGDTCLPEYLLARLSEDARLMGVREQIRSLHEADRFGLFSNESDDDADSSSSSGGGDSGEDEKTSEENDGGGGEGDKPPVLPDNVKRMLAMMRVTRLDKVAALNGFTTIEAEVEFSPKNASTKADAAVAPRPAAAAKAGGKAGDAAEPSLDEPPVYLIFRFRREALVKLDGGGDKDDDKVADDLAASGSGAALPLAGGGVQIVNLDDEDKDDKEVESVVMVPQEGAEGEEEVKRGRGSDRSRKSALSSCCDTSGCSKARGEGRKRAGSRERESDGAGGGSKGRKRPKGREQEEEEEGGGEVKDFAEEECKIGCCGSESPGGGLDFEPRTLVSYTISGGIGFERPELLLQAVVYARGDGPACVMPPPESADADEAGDNREDVFDCNVDGPALAAVGKSLGLHFDPIASDSSSNGGERDEEAEKWGSVGGEGGMTLSDLVWWVMMFPFFEKEFDMVDVVASSVFGDAESDSDDASGEGGDDDSDEDGPATSLYGGENGDGDGMSDPSEEA